MSGLRRERWQRSAYRYSSHSRIIIRLPIVSTVSKPPIRFSDSVSFLRSLADRYYYLYVDVRLGIVLFSCLFEINRACIYLIADFLFHENYVNF